MRLNEFLSSPMGLAILPFLIALALPFTAKRLRDIGIGFAVILVFAVVQYETGFGRVAAAIALVGMCGALAALVRLQRRTTPATDSR